MQLQFKDQDYQLSAVRSVVGVFEGQPRQSSFDFDLDPGLPGEGEEGKQEKLPLVGLGHGNALVQLSMEALLHNVHRQQGAQIEQSSSLCTRLGAVQLDVEMETGTGKTYVYIRTMHELHKQYGWTKYIVVVPSIAIREGVERSFTAMETHFLSVYGVKARHFVYDSDHLDQVQQYAESPDLSVMIINVGAFNSSFTTEKVTNATRLIYGILDKFASRRPIDVIASCRPILVLDEPQKMGSEGTGARGKKSQTASATQRALQSFKPLFALYYSATHRDRHNLVYRLDALDAYQLRLVKRIEVVGYKLLNLTGTDRYLLFQGVVLDARQGPRVRLDIDVKSGSIIRNRTRVLGVGDSVEAESGGLPEYKGLVVSDIAVPANGDTSQSTLTFLTGERLRPGEGWRRASLEQQVRVQIRETIEAHLRKEQQLYEAGIKCLSLFFLDEVSNYRQYGSEGTATAGPYAKIFEEEYADLVDERLAAPELFGEAYVRYLEGITAAETHNGYFSKDSKGHSVNSKLNSRTGACEDESAYDLILRDKERLLSLETKLRFIFSHSALREGWDNPNVFQICTLRETHSETQRRQEVGRGLRLCVNQAGARQDQQTLGDRVHDINRLTVIASESYSEYAGGLQAELKASTTGHAVSATPEYFAGQTCQNATDGSSHKLSPMEASLVYAHLFKQGYIDLGGTVQAKFYEDQEARTLEPFTEPLSEYTADLYRLVNNVHDPSAVSKQVENARTATVEANSVNKANFYKPEFQALWQRLNHKWNYLISFDSGELIRNSIASLDSELPKLVPRLTYVAQRGIQKSELRTEDIQSGSMMEVREQHSGLVRTGPVTSVKYDLLGRVSTGAHITRQTAADILMGIQPATFELYKYNPEAFLREASRLIGEQRATAIVKNIQYNELTDTYSEATFTLEHPDAASEALFSSDRPATSANSVAATKSVMHRVLVDGTSAASVERRMVSELELSTEVVVYTKLPRGFQIPTPMGNYSPDWAIAFRQGSVQHVYFVAETKGSLDSLQLRGIEQAKIACASALFRQVLNSKGVHYGQVSSYEELLTVIRGGVVSGASSLAAGAV